MALTDSVTALWPYGGSGGQYGSFSTKVQPPPAPTVAREFEAELDTGTIESEPATTDMEASSG